MQYADLKKMDMHMLVMYYKRLVEDTKKENKENKDNQNGSTMNPASMMSNIKMPTINMPSLPSFR